MRSKEDYYREFHELLSQIIVELERVSGGKGQGVERVLKLKDEIQPLIEQQLDRLLEVAGLVLDDAKVKLLRRFVNNFNGKKGNVVILQFQLAQFQENPQSVNDVPKKITANDIILEVKNKIDKIEKVDLLESVGDRLGTSWHPFHLRQYINIDAMLLSIEIYKNNIGNLLNDYKRLAGELSNPDNDKINIDQCILELRRLNSVYDAIKKPIIHPVMDASTLTDVIAMHKEDIEIRDAAGCTLLIYYAIRNRLDLVKIMLDNGADINAQAYLNGPDSGNTALHWAIANAYLPMALYLVKAYKDVINYNLLGFDQTVLHLAIAKGPFHTSVDHEKNAFINKSLGGFRVLINALIKAGANVNIQDSRQYGFSPLHLAVLHRDVELVKLLIKHGAKLDCRDKQGRLPVDLLKLEPDQIKEILKQQCAAFTLNTEDWERRGNKVSGMLQGKAPRTKSLFRPKI